MMRKLLQEISEDNKEDFETRVELLGTSKIPININFTLPDTPSTSPPITSSTPITTFSTKSISKHMATTQFLDIQNVIKDASAKTKSLNFFSFHALA